MDVFDKTNMSPCAKNKKGDPWYSAGFIPLGQQRSRQIKSRYFPAAIFSTAVNAAKQLEELQHTHSITWTYLSPAAYFDPNGKRTGSYKTGKDHLVSNNSGQSYISYADLAIAVLDEIEQPRHINERFTLAGEVSA